MTSVVADGPLLLLAYAQWHELEDSDRELLGLARPFDFPARLVSRGDISTPDFTIELEAREDLEMVRFADRKGPFLRWNQRHYWLPSSLLRLLDQLDVSREALRNRDVTSRLLEIGRLLTLAQAAGVTADAYLSRQHVVSPDAVIPQVVPSSEPDTLELVPAFAGLEQDAKLTRQLDSAVEVKPVYQYNLDDQTSARVVLSPPVQEAVQELRKVRKLQGAARRRFLDRPEEFLSHPSIDLSEFGDRVIGVVAKRVRFYPQIPPSETDWLPAISLRIEDEAGLQDPWEMVVGPAEVGEMLNRLQEARSDGISTFEYQGQDFPANPVIEGKLKELEKRLQPRPDKQASQEEPTPRLELDIKENIEAVEYVSVGDLDAVPALELPGSLRPAIRLLHHQQDGVAWLQGLYRGQRGTGALLADDMGLGKTIQLWTFLEWIRLNQGGRKPALIVCPVSLIENWVDEYEKFFGGDQAVPHYAFARLHGAETRQHLRDGKLDLNRLVTYPYVLTSFETLRQYHLDLPRVDWSCVVLDEAQKIKNPAAQVTRAAKALKADFRIASTGTPVENHLSELWCIVDFVQPGRLGCLKDFLKEFPADPSQADDLTQRIQAKCGTLMRRRLKINVSRDLPAKTQNAPQVPFSLVQTQQYRSLLASKDKAESGSPMLALLQGFRKLCAFHKGAELCSNISDLGKGSSKFAWLVQTLDQIKIRKEKVIVFVELREYQRLLAYMLEEHYKVTVRIINGEVTTARESEGSRQQILKEFDSKPGFQILILSPLAAGVGLTITCANHVIHYMRHWNPAKEDQATDRAYRIGQQKEVFVYYPVCTAPDFKTFDQGLHELLERKRSLAARALFPTLYGEVRAEEVWQSMMGR